jgi:hypothetical protein
MSFIADVEDEIRALIASTITAAELTNIYVATKAAKINILEAAGSGSIGDQFWIVEAGAAIPESRFGMSSEAYRVPLTIMQFIKQDGGDVKDTVRADLELLQHTMRTTEHTAFCHIEDGVVNTSVTDPTVSSILDKTMPWASGTLSYNPGVVSGVF